MAAQYAIMRFAKYKGPEISGIEAHNERTKEKYASNPDVDTGRSHLNFHLVKPKGRYRAEAESHIAEAGCRTRSDSVRLVETLITASPEFFKGKQRKEIQDFFQEALDFIKSKQDPETIVSAVVHMDEKTPHMHLSFVPLTPDGRLSAKEILGNKKKLTQWQDAFWGHMVKHFPDLERGMSASRTGRDHIPPRVFKEMTRLNRQREKLEKMLAGVNAFNAKSRASDISRFLDQYIPDVERMSTQMKKYDAVFRKLKAENAVLTRENSAMNEELEESRHESILKKMSDLKLRLDYEKALEILERIPPEILNVYRSPARIDRQREELPGR